MAKKESGTKKRREGEKERQREVRMCREKKKEKSEGTNMYRQGAWIKKNEEGIITEIKS